ncbi:MAG: Pepco domain-containing protein [Microcoleus sp.]
MSEETIWIVTDDIAQNSDNKRSYRDIPQERGVRISVNELEQKMSRFLQSVGRIFRQAEQKATHLSGVQLDEIEMSVEISGEGEIKLMGTGGKAICTVKTARSPPVMKILFGYFQLSDLPIRK